VFWEADSKVCDNKILSKTPEFYIRAADRSKPSIRMTFGLGVMLNIDHRDRSF
jgi:hypothetical protein